MANYASFGTLLKIGDGATPTENFTTIANVMDISGPSLSLRTAESTHQTSTGGWADYIGTIKDGGQVTFPILFDPVENTHDAGAGLIKDMVDRTKRNFQIVFPDTANTTWTIPALVTGFEPGAPVDGNLTANVTLKVAGQPTLA